MTVSSANALWLVLTGPRVVDMDWRAFWIASLTAPLLFAVSGMVVLVVGGLFTLVAAILGLPAYICLGLPAFHVVITRMIDESGLPSYAALIGAALVAVLLAWPFAFAWGAFQGEAIGEAIGTANFYVGLGILAGPIQGLLFASIYRNVAVPRTVSTAHVFQ